MKPSSQPPRTPSRFFVSCTLLIFACLLLCGIASAVPSITLSKKSGPPTTQILVSGRGFEPNVGVDIYFDTKDEALVVTNGKGEFHNARAYAPRNARPGEHWVTALERNNDKGAQEPFLVQTNWSQFHFDADGTRLNPYENVLNPKKVGNLGVKWSFSQNSGSAVAVVDGVVYLPGASLYAINAETGALLWSYPYKGGNYDTPAVADGAVYFGSWDKNLYAVNARTGALLWTFATDGPIWYSPPTVAEGVVYVGSGDGNLYALNARTGAKLWNYASGGPVESSPVVRNGMIYFGADDDNVYALRASNGALLWRYETGSFVNGVAVREGVVYATSQDANVYALRACNGRELWHHATGKMIQSEPAVANGAVYVSSDDRSIHALNAHTGAELWSFGTYNPVISSPAVADGVVYVGSLDGNLYALNARTGAKLWSYYVIDAVASPTIADGVLYLGSYAFSLQDRSQGEDLAERPDLKTLRPDFSLKASQQVATRSGAD